MHGFMFGLRLFVLEREKYFRTIFKKNLSSRKMKFRIFVTFSPKSIYFHETIKASAKMFVKI